MTALLPLLLASPLLQVPEAPQPTPTPPDPVFLRRTERHRDATLLVLEPGVWDTRLGDPVLPAGLHLDPEAAAEAGYFFVQGEADRMPALRQEIEALGGRTFAYVPHNAWEARLPAAAVDALRSRGRAVVAVHPFFKLSPEIGNYGTAAADPGGRLALVVEYWPDRDVYAEEDGLRALDVEVLESVDSARWTRSLVRARREQLAAIAARPGVRWIEEDAPAELRNDRSRWIIQTNILNDLKLWQAGLLGTNVTIGHIDGRINESSCYFDDPSGVAPGPSHRKIKWWDSAGSADAHGTHTAGSAAGNSVPVNGSIFRIGMAPEAFLVSHSYFPNTSNFGTMLAEANGHGARIHTNSWGNDFTTAYDNRCRDMDAYSHDNEDVLVAFAVTNTGSLKNPENAKSCLAVGATDRNFPERWASGGAGPTRDGRLKPEVYAPGCSTWSAGRSSCNTISMCGTSMACPVVVGGAALVKQYFEDGWYPSGSPNAADAFVPSGSLLRAMLANSAVDLTSEAGYPGYREGWGRILLDNAVFLAGDSRQLWVQDVLHQAGLTQGAVQNHSLSIGGGDLRITLAFADEPGAAGAAAPVVNNLDLVVVAPDGTEYHGNLLDRWNGGASRPNPTKQDPKNTMEMVYVPSAQAGTWSITVRGTTVPVGPQGYALVATW